MVDISKKLNDLIAQGYKPCVALQMILEGDKDEQFSKSVSNESKEWNNLVQWTRRSKGLPINAKL